MILFFVLGAYVRVTTKPPNRCRLNSRSSMPCYLRFFFPAHRSSVVNEVAGVLEMLSAFRPSFHCFGKGFKAWEGTADLSLSNSETIVSNVLDSIVAVADVLRFHERVLLEIGHAEEPVFLRLPV